MKPLQSIFKNKCPRCHKGDVFKTNSFYNLKGFWRMHPTCYSCGLRYEREVGFFYGAMYVSYGLNAGFFIVSYLIDQLYLHAETWKFITFILVSMIVLLPVTYRTARLIWLNIFFPYKKTA